MNKVEAEPGNIQRNAAETTLGFSLHDIQQQPGRRHSPRFPRVQSKDPRRPTTPRLPALARQPREQPVASSCPLTKMKMNRAEVLRNSTKEDSELIDEWSIPELSVIGMSHMSPSLLQSGYSSSHPTEPLVKNSPPRSFMKAKTARRADASLPGFPFNRLHCSSPPRHYQSENLSLQAPHSPRRKTVDDENTSPRRDTPIASPYEHIRQKALVQEEEEEEEHSSKHSRSTCSSVSWSEIHIDGMPPQDSSRNRSTASAELAVHQDVSPRLDKNVRMFAVSSENNNDVTDDSEATRQMKPARASSSESEPSYYRKYRSCQSDQDDDFDSSTLSCSGNSPKTPSHRRENISYSKKKHSSTSSRAKHPPTDLDFALDMESAARKLKRIVKDRNESLVRKKVDFDQLRELLDVYVKDPKQADRERLNQLLDAMSEVTETTDEDYFSASKASTSSPTSKRRGMADHESMGNRS